MLSGKKFLNQLNRLKIFGSGHRFGRQLLMPAGPSFGHVGSVAFGGGLVWLYRKLAGMQEDPEEPGYRHIIFRPQPVKEMEHVTYSNLTPYGKAGISWKHQSGKFFMDVEVPVGSRATVYVPAESKDQVLESGKKPDKDKGVEFKEMQDGYAVFEVSSGIYKFQAPVIGN